jgi:hypothetical protein
MLLKTLKMEENFRDKIDKQAEEIIEGIKNRASNVISDPSKFHNKEDMLYLLEGFNTKRLKNISDIAERREDYEVCLIIKEVINEKEKITRIRGL